MRVIRGKKVIGCQVGGGLMKFQSQGEVFMLPDGTPTLLAFEILPMENGALVIRIGETTYWFAADGKYDGVEVNTICSDPLFEETLNRLLERGKSNRGKAPEPYFTLPGESP
jgi:hypothetical protein